MAQTRQSSRAAIPILVMSVNVGNGRSESLTIFDQDIPLEVANQFARRHGLSPSAEHYLLDQISQSLSSLIRSSSRQQSEMRLSKSRINSGERLHIEGQIWKNKMLKEREALKAQQEEEQAKAFPFKPKISRLSEKLALKDRQELNYRSRHQSSQEGFSKYQSVFPDNEIMNRLQQSRIFRELSLKQSVNKTHSVNYLPLQSPRDIDRQKVEGKEKRVFSLFSMLSNGQDLIVPSMIDPQTIDKDVFQAISPLVEEIEDCKQKINYVQFSEGLERLIKTLSPTQKRVLMLKELKCNGNCNSEKIISGGNIFMRNSEWKNKSMVKIHKEREKKISDQFNGCTFRPKTNEYRKFR